VHCFQYNAVIGKTQTEDKCLTKKSKSYVQIEMSVYLS